MITLGYPNMISVHDFEEFDYSIVGMKNNKRSNDKVD
jgi:hypothetical protein